MSPGFDSRLEQQLLFFHSETIMRRVLLLVRVGASKLSNFYPSFNRFSINDGLTVSE